ncbi:hypothetical protein ACQP2P_10805 [Dactylosporangium sp. CA-139114]|uniref:hypothetical protein n=1 Tax=Dactylosporangium sp. CA-139114 TaxID=3239931 RepID=UPI003D95EA0E
MSVLQNVSEETHIDADSRVPDNRRRRRSGQPPAPTERNSAHTGGSLTRVTANFTPRAMAALDRVSEKTGDSRTDVLNMAVMAYEALVELVDEGDGRSLRVQMPNGEVRILHFLG